MDKRQREIKKELDYLRPGKEFYPNKRIITDLSNFMHLIKDFFPGEQGRQIAIMFLEEAQKHFSTSRVLSSWPLTKGTASDPQFNLLRIIYLQAA